MRTGLTVRVVPAPEEDSLGSFFYPYKLEVSQSFDVSGLEADTLRLALENTGILQGIRSDDGKYALVPQMRAFRRSGGAWAESGCLFDGVAASVPLDGGVTDVRIDYGYYSDQFFRSKVTPGRCRVLQYAEAWNSWYFTPQGYGAVFDSVRFGIPAGVQFFVDCPYAEADGTAVLDLAEKQCDELSFYLLDMKWYKTREVPAGPVAARLFLADRDTAAVSEEYADERVKETERILVRLGGMFPGTGTREINIVEDDLKTQDEKYGYGKTVYLSDTSCAVFADFSFWSSASLVHELVHCYLHTDYKNTDARYFFDEALTEYFAQTAYCDDAAQLERAFDEKAAAFEAMPAADGSSVFDLDRNYVETETGGGTWGIVYYRTPCLIYRLVRDTVGEERFLEAFNEFLRRAEAKKAMLWEDFGAVMKEYGVPGERWERFEAEL